MDQLVCLLTPRQSRSFLVWPAHLACSNHLTAVMCMNCLMVMLYTHLATHDHVYLDTRRGYSITLAAPHSKIDNSKYFSRLSKLTMMSGVQNMTMKDFGAKNADLKGIQYLRNVEDADALVAYMKEAKKISNKAVMVGGGYIGLEVTANLVQNGFEGTSLSCSAHIHNTSTVLTCATWLADLCSEVTKREQLWRLVHAPCCHLKCCTTKCMHCSI